MFGLFGSILLCKGNSSVSVSRSANERSSNVLFIVMLALLLAVPTVVAAGLLTSPLLILLSIVVEKLFSNFTTGLITVVFSCDVVVIGCERVGDEDKEQTFATFLISAFEGNDEDEIMRGALEVVNVTKFG
jgi:hypothetical protein